MFQYMGNKYIWFEGVVEDRKDPLKLGRVKVRIFNIHTDNAQDIPISGLPWAYVLGSTTSAAMNGIGISPNGLVEGTYVTGFFRDGESKQEPVITGVYYGIPIAGQKDTKSNNETTLDDQKAVFNSGIKEDGEEIEPLQDAETATNFAIDLLIVHCTATKPTMDIGASEIKSWHLENGFSDIGYHFVIRRNGVIENGRSITKIGAHANGYNNRSLGIALVGGIDENGKADNNFTTAQFESLKTLIRKFKTGEDNIKVIGHNQVSNKACPSFDVPTWLSNHFENTSLEDDNISSFTIDDNSKIPLTSTDDSNSNIEKTEAFGEDVSAGQASFNNKYPENQTGFIDPNGVYPKKTHLNEPDTNRLCRNENIENTIIATKNAGLSENVSSANNITWSEPASAYSAIYPYNKVIEAESGHTIEIDDTPGAERLHIYHKSGTFIELHPDGSQVTNVKGNNYKIVTKDENVCIKGSCNITIENDANILVKGNMTGEIEGTLDLNSTGTMSLTSDSNIFIGADRIDFDYKT